MYSPITVYRKSIAANLSTCFTNHHLLKLSWHGCYISNWNLKPFHYPGWWEWDVGLILETKVHIAHRHWNPVSPTRLSFLQTNSPHVIEVPSSCQKCMKHWVQLKRLPFIFSSGWNQSDFFFCNSSGVYNILARFANQNAMYSR